MPLNFADVGYEESFEESEERSEGSTDKDWFIDSVRRSVAIIRNASNRKANKMTDEEWHEWLIHSDQQLVTKVQDILNPCCKSMSINADDVCAGLIDTFSSALSDAATMEQRVELCDGWAKSFVNRESVEILYARTNRSCE